MSESVICAYCGKPITDENDITYPFIGSDSPTHRECAENAALEEVADTYNGKGDKGLKCLDHQADIQSSLTD